LELEQLRANLIKNNYPSNIIIFEFDKFIKSKQNTTTPMSIDSEKKTFYLSLPYINEKAELISKSMTKLVEDSFHKTNLVVAFKAPSEIGHLFPFKDKVNDPKKLSLVVYHIKCLSCDANYIGKSKRICDIRFNEHKNDKNSSIYKHHIDTGHLFDYDNISILDRASNDLKLQYKEMLYIRKFKPSLNKQENSELFTLIIRNVQLKTSITRDIEKYVTKKPHQKLSKNK